MLIHEAAALTGLTKKAIRYYAEHGLLPTVPSTPPDGNPPTPYRHYSEGDVQRLLLIKELRRLGMSVSEMVTLLETGEDNLRGPLTAYLARMNQDLTQLTMARDTLAGLLTTAGPRLSAQDLTAALVLLPPPSSESVRIFHKIGELFPGPFGRMLAHHYLPFLEDAAASGGENAWELMAQALDDCPSPALPEEIRDLYLMLSEATLEELTAAHRKQVDRLLNANEEQLADMAQSALQQLKQTSGMPYAGHLYPAVRKLKEDLSSSGFYAGLPEILRRFSPAYSRYLEQMNRLNALFPVRYGESGYILEDEG